MSEYHLTVADKQTGPHSQFYIIQGIREGRLHGTELVWRMGLEGWQPLRQLEDFSSYWPPSPEVLAQAESARVLARTELDRPQPWLRFWARTLDLLWFCCGFYILLHMLMPQAMIHITIQAVRWYIPLEPFFLLVYLPLEAWMLSRYGTTPGKSLLRIQIRTLPGALPTFRQAFHRTFLMMLKGLAFLLPLVSLFTMLWWKVRLSHSGVTAWDEAAEMRVEHGEPEGWRYMVLIGIILGVTMTFAAVMQRIWPEFAELMRNNLSR